MVTRALWPLCYKNNSSPKFIIKTKVYFLPRFSLGPEAEYHTTKKCIMSLYTPHTAHTNAPPAEVF